LRAGDDGHRRRVQIANRDLVVAVAIDIARAHHHAGEWNRKPDGHSGSGSARGPVRDSQSTPADPTREIRESVTIEVTRSWDDPVGDDRAIHRHRERRLDVRLHIDRRRVPRQRISTRKAPRRSPLRRRDPEARNRA
jgi:hypothetical protein